MYDNKLIISIRQVITLIIDSMIHMDFCQKNLSIFNITTDDMASMFNFFSRNKMNNLHLTESMRTDWIQMLDRYCNEIDTTCSDDFEFWPEWLFQCFNELPLIEAIESSYLTWKSEQYRLTPKYDIMRSLVPLVKTILWLWRIMIIN